MVSSWLPPSVVEGKAKIDVGFNATLKAPSKLPNKYDSYDALMLRNQVVERELGIYLKVFHIFVLSLL